MVAIIEAFKENTGQFPQHIICYRDGVSDSQFDVVLEYEVPAIKGALNRVGVSDEDTKILILVCQKNHHTRFVYEEAMGDTKYHNVSPGIVVDAGGGDASITSTTKVEFY